MTCPLALRKVALPPPRPLPFEEVVYEAERCAGLAYVLSTYLEAREEPEAQQTAALLTNALERQATALRCFMDTPDDPAEAPDDPR